MQPFLNSWRPRSKTAGSLGWAGRGTAKREDRPGHKGGSSVHLGTPEALSS